MVAEAISKPTAKANDPASKPKQSEGSSLGAHNSEYVQQQITNATTTVETARQLWKVDKSESDRHSDTQRHTDMHCCQFGISCLTTPNSPTCIGRSVDSFVSHGKSMQKSDTSNKSDVSQGCDTYNFCIYFYNISLH